MLDFLKRKYELYDTIRSDDGSVRITVTSSIVGMIRTANTYTLSIRMLNEYFWHLRLDRKFINKVHFERQDGKEVVRYSDNSDLSKILYSALIIHCLKSITKIYANYTISKTENSRSKNLITKNKKAMYFITDDLLCKLKTMIKERDYEYINRTFLRLVRYEKLDITFKNEDVATIALAKSDNDAAYSVDIIPSLNCGVNRLNNFMFMFSKNSLLSVYNGYIDKSSDEEMKEYDAIVINVLINRYKEFLDLKYKVR